MSSYSSGQVNIDSLRVIYLHDGSVVRGKIVEDNDFFIRTVVQTGDTLTIGYKYIDQSKESKKSTFHVASPRPKTFRTEGSFFLVTIGASDGQGIHSSLNSSLTVGKRLSGRLNLGGGVGYDINEFTIGYNYLRGHFFHIHGFARYYLNKSKTRWYLSNQLGYSFAQSHQQYQVFDHDIEGGIFLSGGVGVHFSSRQKFRFIVEPFVLYQQSSGYIAFDSFNDVVETNYRKQFLNFGIRVGIEF